MSSRQLRKLQQQRELEQAQAKIHDVEEEEEDDAAPTKPRASLFAGFAALDDAGEDDSESEEAEEASTVVTQEPIPHPATKKSKKSKKKKAKNKVKEEPVEEVDEIDAALRDLAFKQPAAIEEDKITKLAVDPEYERVCILLGIQTQHLKIANEFRNLFGKSFTEANEDEGQAARGGRRRNRAQPMDLETALKGHHAPGKGLSALTIRRNNLIEGKNDWPKGTTGGLTMAVVDDKTDDGTVEFTYVHEEEYQKLQQAFHEYVEVGDPQNLIGLLQRNPYHISLLIQVSKIAKDQTDHALSSDLLERALFSFGRAASSLFNTKLAQGKARLDFARPENREFWLAGYQYIKALVMKGTYRTALEWAKCLLSLDPEGDHYCMRLMVHHLALRAHEMQWLLDVYESEIPDIWETSGGRSQIAYHTIPSLAFAALQLREPTKCRELLADAMNKVPWVFTRLFSELNLDAPPSIWGITARTDAEALFTELYVHQTKDLWNTPEATSLLMEVAHTIPKVGSSVLPKLENDTMNLDVVRFVYLDNTPSLMSMVPSKLLHRENTSDSDPLPPDLNIFSYYAQRRWVEGGSDDRQELFGGAQDIFNNPFAAIAHLIHGRNNIDGENNFVQQQLREIERRIGAQPGALNDVDEDLDGQRMPGQLEEMLGIGQASRQPTVEDVEDDEEARGAGYLQQLLRYIWSGNGNFGPEEEPDEEPANPEDMPELEAGPGSGDDDGPEHQ